MNIRRNADGQQSLYDLRRELAASPHSVYRQGDSWIVSQWSEAHKANIVTPAPHWYSERNAIQKALRLEVESKDEAAMRAKR